MKWRTSAKSCSGEQVNGPANGGQRLVFSRIFFAVTKLAIYFCKNSKNISIPVLCSLVSPSREYVENEGGEEELPIKREYFEILPESIKDLMIVSAVCEVNTSCSIKKSNLWWEYFLYRKMLFVISFRTSVLEVYSSEIPIFIKVLIEGSEERWVSWLELVFSFAPTASDLKPFNSL